MTVPEFPKSSAASGRRPLWISAGAVSAAALCVGGLVFALSYQINKQLADSCGSILVVVNPEGSTLEQVASDVSLSKGIVRMLYTVNRPGETAERRSVIICAFGSASYWSSINPDLVAASVDGRSLGPARIALLNRFWLSKGAEG